MNLCPSVALIFRPQTILRAQSSPPPPPSPDFTRYKPSCAPVLTCMRSALGVGARCPAYRHFRGAWGRRTQQHLSTSITRPPLCLSHHGILPEQPAARSHRRMAKKSKPAEKQKVPGAHAQALAGLQFQNRQLEVQQLLGTDIFEVRLPEAVPQYTVLMHSLLVNPRCRTCCKI